MDTTIVVPFDSGADRLRRCLESLADLDETPRHRVLLIDNATRDTAELLARMGGDVDLVRLPTRTSEASALATVLPLIGPGRVVLLRECGLVSRDWLAGLLDALDDPGVAAAVSPTAGSATHPTEALAVAWRREALADVPDAGDRHLVAALMLALSPGGRAVVASGGYVAASAPAVTGAHAGSSEPGQAPVLSVVIPTLDAASRRAAGCVTALQTHTRVPHEIILVDNGSAPQGYSAPVNSGLRAARGAYLVVCNDDVEVTPEWWPPLQAALDAGERVVFPRTLDSDDHPLFSAWCFAFGRDTLESHAVAPGEFFDPGLVVWYQDSDLLIRLASEDAMPRRIDASHVRHRLSASVETTEPWLREWVDRRIDLDARRFEAKTGWTVRDRVAYPPGWPFAGQEGRASQKA